MNYPALAMLRDHAALALTFVALLALLPTTEY